MERLNRNIRALQTALEQRPEIFHPVCVNKTFNISLRVIDNAANVGIVKTVITTMRIGVDVGTFFDVASHSRIKNRSGSSRNNHRADAPVTLKQSHYSNL